MLTLLGINSHFLIFQVGLYDSKSIDMQNELIDLPSKQEDMHLLLLSYREELIHAKARILLTFFILVGKSLNCYSL